MNLSRLVEHAGMVETCGVIIALNAEGATHTGIVYKITDEKVFLLHQAFQLRTKSDHLTADNQFSHPRLPAYRVAIPGCHPTLLRHLRSLCVAISRRGDQLPFALEHNAKAAVKGSGQIVVGKAPGNGLNCSTFTLAVLDQAGIRLIDFKSWPARPTDVPDHEKHVAHLQVYVGSGECAIEHFRAVQAQVGCPRVRPEEVAASCLEDSVPVPQTVAEESGIELVKMLRAALSGPGNAVPTASPPTP